MLHTFTDLAEAIDDLPRDKFPSSSTPPPSEDNKKILERLGAIEKQLNRIQTTCQPKPPHQPTWTKVAANPIPPTVAILRGRAITLRPTDDTYKGKET